MIPPAFPQRLIATLAVCALATAALAQDFRPESYAQQVGFLASPALRGRASGEEGNVRAAHFIADAFRKSGLIPLGSDRQKDPRVRMDGRGYYQPFAFPYGIAQGTRTVLEATIGERRTRYRAGVEFEPYPLSAAARASGTVTFDEAQARGKILAIAVGADLRGIDLAGRIARARDAGALALLIAQPKTAGNVADDLDPASADAGLPVLLVRPDLLDAWRAAPTPPQVTVAADIRRESRVTANIAGLLEGTDPILKREMIVVGAHMDHLGMGGVHSLADGRTPAIHPGADDNASGTVGVLELAAYFARPENRPRRSLLFVCFSGEERGLLGSAYYIKHPLRPLADTIAMLNMDMIGRMRAGRVSVIGVGTSPAWGPLLDRLAPRSGLDVTRDDGGFGGSDHQSFAAQKIPVLFYFTGLHSDYHRPTDTPDKIDAVGATKILALVARTASAIAALPERPAYQEVAVAAPGRSRARASLGTIPEYGAGVVGVLLGGVRPGSPADQAGLKAGDILIGLGGKTIRNIEEYTAALGAFAPGETVELIVKRGAETLTLKATLAESRR
jgi:hypothetical protein